jgi:hypothetical protein
MGRKIFMVRRSSYPPIFTELIVCVVNVSSASLTGVKSTAENIRAQEVINEG